MKKRELSKRLLAMLLVCVMCLTLAPEALAESALATAMRLTKSEGTVAIANSSGRNVPVREDLRLYSGYGIDTEDASYAWISLDSAKLVKEDAVSEISIRKSGKKLDILVDSGNLFFNVKEPLDSDETFHIRTSTMAIGIRGTCGWVKVIDQWTSIVYILEGSVEVTVTDPVTGETKTEIITGGETARCVVYPQDRSGDKCDIIHSTFTVDDIDGFVLVEAVPDSGLCDKIYADSGLDLRGWTAAQAEEVLKKDQAAIHEKLNAIEEQVSNQDRNISTSPVWTDPVPGGTSTPTVSAPGGVYAPPIAPAVGPVITLTMPQDAETVNNYLSQNSVTGVILQPGVTRESTANLLDIDSPVTVPKGKTLTLQTGVSAAVQEGQTLQVDGTMTVGGDISNNGRIGVTSPNTHRVQGNLTNTNTMSVSATGRVVVDGTFTQQGSLSPVSGAVIQARSFVMTMAVPYWTVSETADSQGYYTLVSTRAEPDPGITANVSGTVFDADTSLPIANARVTQLMGYVDTVTHEIKTEEIVSTLTDANGRFSVEMRDWKDDPTASEYGFFVVISADGYQASNGRNYDISDWADSITKIGDKFYLTPTNAKFSDGEQVFIPNIPDAGGVQSNVELVAADGTLKTATIALTYPTSNGSGLYTIHSGAELAGPYYVTAMTSSEIRDRYYVGIVGNSTVTDRLYVSVNTCERTADGFSIADTSPTFQATDSGKYYIFEAGKLTESNAATVLAETSPSGINGSANQVLVAYTRDGGSITATYAISFHHDSSSEETWLNCLPTAVTWRYDEPTRTLYIEGSGAMEDYSYKAVDESARAYSDNRTQKRSIVSFAEGDVGGGESDSFSVTFVDDITGEVIAVQPGLTRLDDAEYPEHPSHEGWKGNGWSGPEPDANGNYIIRAQYTPLEVDPEVPNTIKVTFKDGLTDETLDERDVEEAPGITEYPNAPTHEGYEFTSWTIGTPDADGNVTITANYRPVEVPIEEGHTVTWVNWNGTALEQRTDVPEGTDIPSSDFRGSTPTRPSDGTYTYTFTGWSMSVDANGNVTYTAQYSATVTPTPPTSHVTTAPWSQYYDVIERVVIEEGVTSIGAYAFHGCTALVSASISSTVSSIGSDAFNGCTSLESISISDGVTTIESSAFFRCTSLADVYYGGTRAQWNSLIPNIGANNEPLLNATIHCIDDADASGSAGENVSWSYNAATKTLRIWGEGPMDDYAATASPAVYAPWNDYQAEIEHVVVESGVTTIGNCAFWGCTALTDAHMPNSLTRIGNGAFYNCAALKDAPIPNGVTTILQAAFSGCESLTSVTVPDTVTSLGHDAFSRCTALADVKLSNSLAMIDNSTFDHCTSLETISIPNGVTEIRNGAFLASGLTSLTLPSGLTTIGPNAFNACASLSEVTLPASLTSVGLAAFLNCTALTTATYPGTEAQWTANVTVGTRNDPLLNALHFTDGADASGAAGENVSWSYNEASKALRIWGTGPMEDYRTTYANGSASVATDSSAPWRDYRSVIETVSIEDGVTSIGSSSFAACTNLANVEIPDSVVTIGSNAFDSCSALVQVTVPGTVTDIGDSAFRYCTAMTNATIPSGVGSIGARAFQYCSSLTAVSVAGSVTAIGDAAFNSCTSLTNVELPDSVTNFGNFMFQDCSELASAKLPSQITTLGNSTFSRCSKLTDVTVPNTVEEIGIYAFNNCSSLTAVNIPAGVTSVGYYAFDGCTALTDVYFGGTQEAWDAITTGANNEPLLTAALHPNSATRTVVSNAAPGYTDVPADAWYAEAVAYCRDNGLMNGTSETTFSPDGTLTRAMMVTVLHRLAGKPAAASAAAFRDVEAGQWYTEAVSWASGRKIVLGYNESTFGTNDPVTHEQATLIFQRYSGDSSMEAIGAETPKAPATRAEIAAALMNFAKSQLAPGTLSAFSAMNIMCGPSGIALDRDGSFLVTDVYHKQVWRVLNRDSKSYAGGATVQDLYGQPIGGYNDAALDGSYFKEPWAIAPFLNGWAVSDTANNVVRLIQSTGVQTLNGATKEKLKVTELGVAFDHPTGLAADDDGNLYISDTFNGAVRRITPEGSVSTAAQNLSEPMGLFWKDGVLYIAETGKNRVVKLEDGKVSTAAGNGTAALADGAAARASFNAPQGVAVGSDGSIYVADTGNSAVRRVKDGSVTTLTVRETDQLTGGLTSPVGLLVLDGKLYICDSFARKVFIYQL